MENNLTRGWKPEETKIISMFTDKQQKEDINNTISVLPEDDKVEEGSLEDEDAKEENLDEDEEPEEEEDKKV